MDCCGFHEAMMRLSAGWGISEEDALFLFARRLVEIKPLETHIAEKAEADPFRGIVRTIESCCHESKLLSSLESQMLDRKLIDREVFTDTYASAVRGLPDTASLAKRMLQRSDFLDAYAWHSLEKRFLSADWRDYLIDYVEWEKNNIRAACPDAEQGLEGFDLHQRLLAQGTMALHASARTRRLAHLRKDDELGYLAEQTRESGERLVMTAEQAEQSYSRQMESRPARMHLRPYDLNPSAGDYVVRISSKGQYALIALMHDPGIIDRARDICSLATAIEYSYCNAYMDLQKERMLSSMGEQADSRLPAGKRSSQSTFASDL